MTILGTAYVIIAPEGTDFAAELAAQVDPAIEETAATIASSLGEAGAVGADEMAAALSSALGEGGALGGISDVAAGEGLAAGLVAGFDPSGTGDEIGSGVEDAIASGAGGGGGLDTGKKLGGGIADGAEGGLVARGSSIGGTFAKRIVDGAIAVGVGRLFESAVNEATGLAKATDSVRLLFGQAATEVLQLGKNSATSLGQSNLEVLTASVNYGNLLRSLGFTKQAAAGMSVELIKVATDLASVRNVPVPTALNAIQSGLAGMTRPLRQFGIDLRSSALQDEAVSEGLIKKGEVLDSASKAQAAYSLILKDSTVQQGNFAATSNSTANQQKILAAEFKNEKAALGEELMPIYRDFLVIGGGVLKFFEALPGPVQVGVLSLIGITAASKALAPEFRLIQSAGEAALSVIRRLRGVAPDTITKVTTPKTVTTPAESTSEGSTAVAGGSIAEANQEIATTARSAEAGLAILQDQADEMVPELEALAAALRGVAVEEEHVAASAPAAGAAVTTAPAAAAGGGVEPAVVEEQAAATEQLSTATTGLAGANTELDATGPGAVEVITSTGTAAETTTPALIALAAALREVAVAQAQVDTTGAATVRRPTFAAGPVSAGGAGGAASIEEDAAATRDLAAANTDVAETTPEVTSSLDQLHVVAAGGTPELEAMAVALRQVAAAEAEAAAAQAERIAAPAAAPLTGPAVAVGASGGAAALTEDAAAMDEVAAAEDRLATQTPLVDEALGSLGITAVGGTPELEALAAALRDVAVAEDEAAAGAGAEAGAGGGGFLSRLFGRGGGAAGAGADAAAVEEAAPALTETTAATEGLTGASIGLGTATAGALAVIAGGFSIYSAWSKNVNRVKDEETQLAAAVIQSGQDVTTALQSQYQEILKTRGGFQDVLNRSTIAPTKIVAAVDQDPAGFDKFRKIFQDQGESIEQVAADLDELRPKIPATVRPFVDELISLHQAGVLSEGDVRKIVDGATDLSKEAQKTGKELDVLGQRFYAQAVAVGVNSTTLQQLDTVMSNTAPLTARQAALKQLETEYPKIAEGLGLISQANPEQIFDKAGNAETAAAAAASTYATTIEKEFGVVNSAISASQGLASAKRDVTDASKALADAIATENGQSDQAIALAERLASATQSLADAKAKRDQVFSIPLATIPTGETLADLTPEQQQTLTDQSQRRIDADRAVSSAQQQLGDVQRAKAKQERDDIDAVAKARQDLVDKQQAVVGAAIQEQLTMVQLGVALKDQPGLIDDVVKNLAHLRDTGAITPDQFNAAVFQLGIAEKHAKDTTGAIEGIGGAVDSLGNKVVPDMGLTETLQKAQNVQTTIEGLLRKGATIGDILGGGQVDPSGKVTLTPAQQAASGRRAEEAAGVSSTQAAADNSTKQSIDDVNSRIKEVKDLIAKAKKEGVTFGPNGQVPPGLAGSDVDPNALTARLNSLNSLRDALQTDQSQEKTVGDVARSSGSDVDTARHKVDDLTNALKTLGITKPVVDVDTSKLGPKIDAAKALLGSLQTYENTLASGNPLAAIGGLGVAEHAGFGAGLTLPQVNAAVGIGAPKGAGSTSLAQMIASDEATIAADQALLKKAKPGSPVAAQLSAEISSTFADLVDLQKLREQTQGFAGGGFPTDPGIVSTIAPHGLIKAFEPQAGPWEAYIPGGKPEKAGPVVIETIHRLGGFDPGSPLGRRLVEELGMRVTAFDDGGILDPHRLLAATGVVQPPGNYAEPSRTDDGYEILEYRTAQVHTIPGIPVADPTAPLPPAEAALLRSLEPMVERQQFGSVGSFAGSAGFAQILAAKAGVAGSDVQVVEGGAGKDGRDIRLIDSTSPEIALRLMAAVTELGGSIRSAGGAGLFTGADGLEYAITNPDADVSAFLADRATAFAGGGIADSGHAFSARDALFGGGGPTVTTPAPQVVKVTGIPAIGEVTITGPDARSVVEELWRSGDEQQYLHGIPRS